VSPAATLEWVLLDFGTAGKADVRAVENINCWPPISVSQRRAHEEIVFKVAEGAFFTNYPRLVAGFDVCMSRNRRWIRPSKFRKRPRSAFKLGLTTAPDVYRRRGQQAARRAAFDLESVQVEETRTRRLSLAEAIGLTPTTPFRCRGFFSIANAHQSGGDSVEEMVIDRSLEQRPDLFVEGGRPCAEKGGRISAAHDPRYYPTLTFSRNSRRSPSISRSDGTWRAKKNYLGTSTQQPTWGVVGLALTWSIFDGGARKTETRNRHHRSVKRDAEAKHDLVDSRDYKAISQIWRLLQ